MYEAWCKMKNRKILVHKPSTLHMSITNEIKIAFPQVYVQSRMYKGLKFKDSINENPPNEYLSIQNMNGSSTNFNSSSNSNTNGNTNGNMKVNLSGSNGNRNFSNGNNRDKNKASSQEDYYVLKE